MNKFVVVIPARGGSKRFPDKNIYPLDGKPLIAYSINYAKAYDDTLDVYVSTDSQRIADVSRDFGAKIIQRPPELAEDHVSTAAALQHFAYELTKAQIEFDYVILLQPTNPLRPDDLLKDAIEIINSGQHDSLMTVSPSYLKFGKIIEDRFIPWNYQYGQRSQDLKPLYYENGLLYISKKELILKGSIIGEKMYPMIIDNLYGTIDIDTIDDLKYAEFIMRQGKEV
jgi:N-acylneuraminate cytidylyltransferase